MRKFLFVLFLFSFHFPVKADSDFIVVGTGDLTGVYYPAGGAICRLVNKERNLHGIRCAVESTQGSTYNLNALKRGELDLAIVQPDWLYHAAMGSSIFAQEGASKGLRTLMNLHSEALTIVARKDSGIKTFRDLKGKKVNLGSPESGQRRTMDLILSTLGWDYNDFEIASELSASDMSEALCSGRIDAFVYVVGHPNASISEATTFCESIIIPLPDELIKEFSALYPFYSAGEISGALYRGNPDPIATIKLTARLVSAETLSERTAFELSNVIFNNFESLAQMHPALKGIRRDQAFDFDTKIAPVHKGVMRFLKHSAHSSFRKNP